MQTTPPVASTTLVFADAGGDPTAINDIENATTAINRTTNDFARQTLDTGPPFAGVPTNSVSNDMTTSARIFGHLLWTRPTGRYWCVDVRSSIHRRGLGTTIKPNCS